MTSNCCFTTALVVKMNLKATLWEKEKGLRRTVASNFIILIIIMIIIIIINIIVQLYMTVERLIIDNSIDELPHSNLII